MTRIMVGVKCDECGKTTRPKRALRGPAAEEFIVRWVMDEPCAGGMWILERSTGRPSLIHNGGKP